MDLHIKINHLTRKVDEHMSETQDKLDALAVRLTAIGEEQAAAVAELTDGLTGVRGDVQALKDAIANGQPADFSAVDAGLDAVQGSTDTLKAQADALAALDAENPAPEPPQ